MIESYTKMFQALFPENLSGLAKEKGTWKSGLKIYALAWGAASLLSVIVVAALQLARGGTADAALAGVADSIAWAVIMGVAALPAYLCSYYMGSWFAIRFMGAKGEMGQVYNVAMLFIGASTLIMTIASAILLPFLPATLTEQGLEELMEAASAVCIMGVAVIAMGVALWAYKIYLLFLSIKEVHKLENQSAGVVVVLMLAVHLAIYMLVEVALLQLIFGAAAGAG